MTSKEFSRRLQYYANFLTAFDCFQAVRGKSHIWKITVLDINGSVHVFYRLSPYVVSSDSYFFDFDVDSLVVERYSRLRFDVDLKYFKSFLSKLSEYQLSCITTDSRFTNILKFINYVKS